MRFTLPLVALLFAVEPVHSQPKPNAYALPQSPTLSGPPTLGMTRGTTAEVTLAGANLLDAVAVFTTAPGVTAAIPPGQADAAKLKVQLTAAADGPIGLFQLRVATKHGVSNFRPFCLDELPEVAEAGDISKKEKAQTLNWPCVVTGGVAVEAADYYKVAVKPGQKLMLEVLARRIGSPTDPVIILHDAKTLRELPALYADDTPGLQGDCRLAVPGETEAEYLVEVRDMTYQGGPAHGYRLRVGEYPVAATAFPLAENTASPRAGFESGGRFPAIHYLSPKSSGRRGWPVPVRVTDIPVMEENESNDTPEAANAIPVPGGVSAGFTKKGDRDHFRFEAKQGVKYVVEAATGEFGAATEVYIRILDKAGKELVASDPQKVQARAEVTAAANGPLVIACEHLLYLSGPNEVYFLTVKEARPDVEVVLGTDRIDLPAGGRGVVPVVGLNRLNGQSGRIFLEARVGDSGFGLVAVPEGVIPTADKPILLPIAAGGVSGGAWPLKVHAFGDGLPNPIRREAAAAEVVKAGFGNLFYPPAEMATQFVAGVYEPRVTLTLPDDAMTLKPGEKAKVKLARAGGYKGDLALTYPGLPAGVSATPAVLKADAAEVDVELACDAKAAGGVGRLVVRGQVVKPKGKEKEPDYAVLGVGGEVTVAGEVKKEPVKKK